METAAAMQTNALDWTSAVGHAAGQRAARRARQEWLHRGIDIAGSLVLLLLTAPILVLAGLAIRLESAGPVLYRQVRIGLNGREFVLLKLRSMVADAEKASGPSWAAKGDPRVTRIGRLMRLTRIDELPQLINVLSGDMSLVGPRPERPHFVRLLIDVIPGYAARSAVKPGITGWAQVNYPYGASVQDAEIKLRYDLQYIERRGILLDCRILLSTVLVVLLARGAR